MRLPELAALYLLVSLGAAVGLIVARRPLGMNDVVDTVLLGAFWPLYGPFLLLQERSSPAGELSADGLPEAELPLTSLLPDPDTAAALERRLDLARSRVEEIDCLLGRPEFSEEAAIERQRLLETRGDERAAATARQRVGSIRRLRRLRQRFAAELDEIREIVTQFRIQAEVVRLSGEDDGESSRELLNELHLRLETLDEMLSESTGSLASAPCSLP